MTRADTERLRAAETHLERLRDLLREATDAARIAGEQLEALRAPVPRRPVRAPSPSSDECVPTELERARARSILRRYRHAG